MAVQAEKSTRADEVRQRRLKAGRRRPTARQYDTARAATSTVRPLVSWPRRSTHAASAAAGSHGRLHRRGSGGWLPALPTLRLPALPRLPISWRLASFSMVLLLTTMLVRLLTDPRMFVDGVNLGGAALVPGEELYARSGIANQHIFWVDPADVQRRVAAVPGIAHAHATVKWPNEVTIVIIERIPVVTWIEHGRRWWVDADGQKFKARENLPGLLPITVDGADGKATEPNDERVPVEAIQGALQLRELRSNIEMLHYDPERGLSYQDGRGWRGYFGVGTDMPQKLAVYERLTEQLLAQGIAPELISVENALAPYYLP